MEVDISLEQNQKLWPESFPPIEKTHVKDRPTFLLRSHDLVNKVPVESVLEGNLNQLQSNKLVWCAKDIADAINKGNQGLNDMTVVFCWDPA